MAAIEEHFVKGPMNNFKISSCNKLSSTYIYIPQYLLIRDNKLKYRKANDEVIWTTEQYLRAWTTGNIADVMFTKTILETPLRKLSWQPIFYQHCSTNIPILITSDEIVGLQIFDVHYV